MPHKDAIDRPQLDTPKGGHTREEKLAAFGRLLDIMDDLREGCPWDRWTRRRVVERWGEAVATELDRNEE